MDGRSHWPSVRLPSEYLLLWAEHSSAGSTLPSVFCHFKRRTAEMQIARKGGTQEKELAQGIQATGVQGAGVEGIEAGVFFRFFLCLLVSKFIRLVKETKGNTGKLSGLWA